MVKFNDISLLNNSHFIPKEWNKGSFMLQTTKQLVREYSIPMFALWDQVVTQNRLFRGARNLSASVDGLLCGDKMIPLISLIFG